MNMVMNNDGSGNIIQLNTLLPPALWPEDRKKALADAMGVKANTILNR
jgi:type I restriction enzyme M protein